MKNKIRVLSLIMTLAIVLSSLVIVVPVGAEELVELKDLNTITDGQPWTTFAAEEGFAGGEGTEEDPWQIETAEQLALLAAWSNDASNYAMVQTAYFVLTADIDLAGHEWVAIAQEATSSNPDNRFKGHFDGQGYVIRNLTVTNATKIEKTNKVQRTALFGYTGGAAEIKNFTLTGSIAIDTHKNGGASVAMVVAEASGKTVVSDVDVYGVIDVKISVSETPIAGIVGRAHNVFINNCTMNGSVTVTSETKGPIPLAGGIAAYASSLLSATNCVNNADIFFTANENNSIAGGIVAKCGQINDDNPTGLATTLTGCINNGDITVSAITGTKGPNNQRVGGIVGNVGRNCGGNKPVDVVIKQCVNTGDLVLNTGVTLGGGSGLYPIAGFMESWDVTVDGEKVRTYSNITISECLNVYEKTERIEPHYKGDNVLLNGMEKYSGYGISDDSDIHLAVDLEVEGTDAIIRMSKSTNAFVGSGYKVTINYGEEEIVLSNVANLTDIEEVTEESRSYALRVPYVEGAVPTMSVTGIFFAGTDLEETVTIEADEATWSDFYTEAFAASQTLDEELYPAGSEDNPYIISSAGKLASLADRISKFDKTLVGKYFIIVRDIDLSAHEWQPAGMTQPSATNNNYKISGTIFGYDHTISGVRLTQDNYYYTQSFFGYSLLDVQDLIFDGIEIKTPETLPANGTIKGVNGLIGAMYGGSLTNVHVKNLDIDYEVNEATDPDLYIAGLVGYLVGGEIIDCSVSGTIDVNATNMNLKIGGMVSRGRAGTIENSVSDLVINAMLDNADKGTNSGVGGFVGVVNANNTTDNVSVKNSVNNSIITVNYSNKGGNIGVAGVIGASVSKNATVVIDDCVDNGVLALNHVGGTEAVNAKKAAMIGYFGSTTLTVTDCVAMAESTFVGSVKSGSVPDNEANGNVFVDLALNTENKASLRLDIEDATDSGLAFTSSFDKSAYDALAKKGYTLTFGTLIAPTEDLVAVNGDVTALDGMYVTVGYDKDVTNGLFTGAFINMGLDYLATDFSAVAYVTIEKDSVSYTVYGDFDAAGARSVKTVVQALLADRNNAEVNEYKYLTNEGDYSPYEWDQLEALKAIYEDYFPLVNIEQEN